MVTIRRAPPESLAAAAARGVSCLLLLLGLLGPLAGCSGDGGGAPADGGSTTDGYGQLFPCDEPGRSCNAHNPCAIDPICGEDRLCRPQGLQDCDDGLHCTVNHCLGSGRCDHEIDRAWCTLIDQSGKLACMLRGAVKWDEPCKICDSLVSQTRWSPRPSGACDDGDPCTVYDQCIEGVCRGTRYSCSDRLTCTEDICDGQGGCANPLSPGTCLIDGVCRDDQELSSNGCLKCDPAVSTSSWTVVEEVCKLGNRCLQSGELDLSGCGICDPAVDATGWTPAPGTCLIDGVCYQDGQQPAGSCGVCDSIRSPRQPSPQPDECLIDGECLGQGVVNAAGCGVCDPAADGIWWTPVTGSSVALSAGFESSSEGFVLDPPTAGVGWQVSDRRSQGGGASLYYGDPGQGNFDAGQPTEGSAVSADIALPAAQRSALEFWVFLDVEPAATHDRLTVEVGPQILWAKHPDTLPSARYRSWVPVTVDLGGFAGQTIKIRFRFDTVDEWANQGEGVYIDDVVVLTGCGPL